MRTSLLAATALLAGCVARTSPSPEASLPFLVDTLRTEHVAAGVVHRFIYAATGPWAIHTLEIDLAGCNQAVAVKGADTAAGRIRTTTMLDSLAKSETVIGGVNADFFSLANGTPVNLLVVDGRMLTPPVRQPVLAVDSSGAIRLGTFTLSRGRLEPFHPRQAVGGRPMLARDSSVVRDVDTEGQLSFIMRNPRTAAGISRDGRRLVLAVVDGRQLPYSDGMTLRELANLMLGLGARDAINLDGGGSSVMVYADPASGKRRIANRPSDREGERAVGDALGIVHRCER
jgi:exopolysaccharide biosynthesis protein